MFTKLLVAVDGGELTQKVTAYVLQLAGTSEVHFVCAVDPNGLFSDAAAATFNAVNDRASAIEAAQRVVDRCVASGNAAKVKSSGHVVEEPPVDAILSTAKRIGADLIVMASHGRSGFARAVIGSVAEGVARRAPIAVLFVPTGLTADDPSRHLHQIFHGG